MSRLGRERVGAAQTADGAYVRELLDRVRQLERANLSLEQDRTLLMRELQALRLRLVATEPQSA